MSWIDLREFTYERRNNETHPSCRRWVRGWKMEAGKPSRLSGLDTRVRAQRHAASATPFGR